MHETTVVIRLRFDERDGALSGRIEARGDLTPFHGWVGLVAALDRLLSGGPEARPQGVMPPHAQGDPR